MKSSVSAIAFLASVLLPPVVAQQSYTFQTVDFPNNAGETYVRGIDSAGDVVGSFSTTAKSGRLIYVGYARLANGRLVTLEDPFTVSNSFALGISDSGEVVGTYQNDGFNGFIYSQGKYRTFDFVSQSQKYPTELEAISTNNLIVGDYTFASSLVGFERTATGAIQVLSQLNGQSVNANGINSSGVIVGFDEASALPGVQSDGFILSPGGTYQTVDYPGAVSTTLSGINDSGVIVGFQQQATGLPASFIYSNGQFTDFAVPGAAVTQAFAINASGVIVGSYSDASLIPTHGFIATPVQ